MSSHSATGYPCSLHLLHDIEDACSKGRISSTSIISLRRVPRCFLCGRCYQVMLDIFGKDSLLPGKGGLLSTEIADFR